MWHEHRKELAEVERQLDGYGSGLTAFYTRAVLRDPRRLLTLARLAPRAIRDLRGKDSVRTATMSDNYPAALRRASMAFDREALLRIGGFDVALGAGTPAQACEDTAAICDLMLAGGTFVYWPGAVMWHQHRETVAEVERQLNGYGSGLTA